MSNNLPASTITDSSAATKLFFDVYGKQAQEFNAVEIDAGIAFFTAKGFVEEAAVATCLTILKRARADGVPLFKILDTLKLLDGVQLSEVVAKILNADRITTSSLGFRFDTDIPKYISRNIRS
jgi:hypothetical protein